MPNVIDLILGHSNHKVIDVFQLLFLCKQLKIVVIS